MDITYKREMKHNYLIICPQKADSCGYESRMLVSNCIEGLLKFRIRYLDSKEYFYYEITSKQPLKRLLENRCITLSELRQLLLQIIRALNRMEAYLLKEGQILLEPDYIYITPEKFDVYLCLIPGRVCDFPREMTKLLQYLLGKVNHQDKECVVLAYGLYQESLKENYGMEDLLALLMKEEDKEPAKKEEEYVEYSVEKKVDLTSCHHNAEENHSVKPDLPSNHGRMIGCIGMTIAGWGMLYWLVGFPRMTWYAVIIGVAQIFIWRKRPIKPKTVTHEEPKEKAGNNRGEKQQWKVMLEEFESEPDGACEKEKIEYSKENEKRITEIPEFQEHQGNTVLLANLAKPQEQRKFVSLDHEEDIMINYFPFIIGKQEGMVDYLLSKDTVSRLHLRIDHEEGKYRVMDLNSTNGTRINGRLLEANETASLTVGDEVFVANVQFRFI